MCYDHVALSFQMAEAMEISYGAIDTRLTSDPDLWAARMRRDKGLTPLPSDEATLLLGELDLMTTPEPLPSLEGTSGGQEAPVPEEAAKVSPAATGATAPQEPSSNAAGTGEPDAERPLKCTACPMAFSKVKRLRIHWEGAHAASFDAYRCPVTGCARAFHKAHKLELRVHLRHVHLYGDKELEGVKPLLKLQTVVSAEGPATVAPPACLAETGPQQAPKKKRAHQSPARTRAPAEGRALKVLAANVAQRDAESSQPRGRPAATACPPKPAKTVAPPAEAPLPVSPSPLGGGPSPVAWDLAMGIIKALQDERAAWQADREALDRKITQLERDVSRLRRQPPHPAKKSRKQAQ